MALDQARVDGVDPRHITGVLDGQGRDDAQRAATLSGDGFDVRLNAGAAAGIVTGNTQDQGAVGRGGGGHSVGAGY